MVVVIVNLDVVVAAALLLLLDLLLLFRDGLERNLLVRVLQFPAHLLRVLQRTEHGAEYDTVEDDPGQDQSGAPPSIVLDEDLGQWGEDERAQATATDCDSCRQGAVLLKVRSHTDDRRQVDQPETESRADSHCEDQRENVLRKGTDDEAEPSQDGPSDCHGTTSVFVDKR